MSATVPGDPVWVDLFTSDPDRAVAFYGELFGWTADRNEDFGGYITFRSGDAAVAGAMGKSSPEDGPDQWTVYLAATDARATAEAAATRGGSVIVPAMAVGDLGTMAVLADPSGAGIGIWQANAFAGIEIEPMGETDMWRHGAPGWFELHTRDYDKALMFYREVFGWSDVFEMPGTPEFRYSTIHADHPMRGGVMDAAAVPAEVALPGWGVYFGAADVDATVAKAIELGATLLHPAEDSPYGRMAVLNDPTGARFSVGGNVANA
ncbi:VOC family protein [Nocardia higoensis]|uniref:VOC family protein n=1 Tax=Nocardia higoensis TaxID=228599 RepID=A0ABS0DD84_9NOCA|nr:VOC family protein [Nocardia higoensis]MBF6354869.1 VOC family protein [Nocardia higoensis]